MDDYIEIPTIQSEHINKIYSYVNNNDNNNNNNNIKDDDVNKTNLFNLRNIRFIKYIINCCNFITPLIKSNNKIKNISIMLGVTMMSWLIITILNIVLYILNIMFYIFLGILIICVCSIFIPSNVLDMNHIIFNRILYYTWMREIIQNCVNI